MNKQDREQIKQDPPRLSTRRWVIQVDRLDCCINCLHGRNKRWGKHSHTKSSKQRTSHA